MDKSVTALIKLLKNKMGAEGWEWRAQHRSELESRLNDLGFRFVTSPEIEPPAHPKGHWWACLENAEGQRFVGFGDEPNIDPANGLNFSQLYLAVYRAAIKALKSLQEAT